MVWWRVPDGKKMIQLIIFDFFGTLAYYDPARTAAVIAKLKEFNLPVDDQKANQRLAEILPEYFSKAKSWEQMADKITQKLGIVLEADRRESLAAFAAKNLPCRLFGDVSDILDLPPKKAILTLCEDFAVQSVPELRNFEIFSPREYGAAKPDPKAFLAVLKKMKAEPRETAMVGDNLENDILPALALGMKAILLDRAGKYEKLNKPAIIKISTLKELKNYL